MNYFSQEKNEKMNEIFDKLSSEKEKAKITEILLKLCSNLIREPNNETYKKLKKSNKVLSSYIYSNPYIMEIVFFIGFFEIDIDGEDCYVIFDVDLGKLNIVITKLQEISTENDKKKIELKSEKPSIIKEEKSYQPNKDTSINNNINKDNSSFKPDNKPKSTQEAQPINNENKNALNLLKETANLRKNMIPVTPIYTQPRDLSSIRLSNMTNQSVVPEFYQNSSNTKSTDKGKLNTADELIGKRCLDLTNEFRKMNKLSPLKWDDHIWNISFSHSKSMGDKLVRFSHDGFEDRIKKYPYGYSTACENIFMCSGVSEDSIPENAVTGWIKSEGHRKNLLSDTTSCAIATYRNSYGEYYLTQIFFR